MRIQLRLLAPFSILATALYLAFWATQHPASNALSITSAGNPTAAIVPSKDAHFAAKPLVPGKTDINADTVSAIRP